ncbi:MAG: hypothetical protein ACOY3P_10050 [Planctomycetota bacterium]
MRYRTPSAHCRLWKRPGGMLLATALCALLAGASAFAQEERAGGEVGPQDAKQENLPLRRVVLFSSGVGFFEHAGSISGGAEVPLRFRTEEINDVLKSLVVEDEGGGQAPTVTYASKDPISKTLKTFAFDLTENPALWQLLAQVRGERVELEAPNKITGTIIGVETQRKKVGDDEFIDVHLLNLLTDEGLRSVPLDTVSRIQLTNDALESELRKALAVLATAHDSEKKTVTVNFAADGQRKVRLGYVQESPIWKTSYRLVLSNDAPWLQGWAIVENPSEQDWTGVDLTLVSGRPISFTMELYDPLYVPRPEMELELYSSLRPQRYQQDMNQRLDEFAKKASPDAPASVMIESLARRARGSVEKQSEMRRSLNRANTLVESEARDGLSDRDADWGMRTLQSVAEAAEAGTMFHYRIAAPVTLPRQQSAMLPIVNAEVKADRLSIYNYDVQQKHPLRGLRLTNSTDLHLMQGPITVYVDGNYAGDAMIEDIPPGSERLISYALNLKTEVTRQSKSKPDEIIRVQLVKGTMLVGRKYVQQFEYTIKNSGDEKETVLVEHSIQPDWKLVQPAEPKEKTRDVYRFAVEAAPGEAEKLVVELERTDTQRIGLTNISDDTIRIYLQSPAVSEKVKQALQEVVRRQHEIGKVAAEIKRLEGQVQEIENDQARIRQNMAQLDRTSEVYKNYVRKFSDQELQIEKLREQIDELKKQQSQLKTELDEHLMGLEIK